MSQKPETKFKEKVQDRFLTEFPDAWVIKTQEVTLRGIPDILMCYRGWFIALELKVRPNKVKSTSLQAYHLTKIHTAGGLAIELFQENLDKVVEEIKCLPSLENFYSRKQSSSLLPWQR